MKTLLCYWYGEALYREDVTREKLLEIIDFLVKEKESGDNRCQD
jgi:hypothetical protein